MSISREEFQKLKPGDVLIWHSNRNNPYFRTVIEGPRWPKGSITLPIRRRSWTTRSSTVRSWHDIKDICTVAKKRINGLFSQEELQHILDLGLKPVWDLKDNIKTSVRMGHCTPRLAVLAKKTLEAFEFAGIK